MTRGTAQHPTLAVLLGVLALAALFPAIVAAQEGAIEITPTVGYRWGGRLYAEDTGVLQEDADLDATSSYGLVIDLPVSRHFQIELLASHQDTTLERGGMFWPEDPGLDLDVTYYHVGALWQWYPSRINLFVATGLGFTDLDADMPGWGSEQRLSISFAAGVKVPISEHVGFRLETRVFGTDTDDSNHDCDDDWCDDCHCHWEEDHDLSQGQITVGISFVF